MRNIYALRYKRTDLNKLLFAVTEGISYTNVGYIHIIRLESRTRLLLVCFYWINSKTLLQKTNKCFGFIQLTMLKFFKICQLVRKLLQN